MSRMEALLKSLRPERYSGQIGQAVGGARSFSGTVSKAEVNGHTDISAKKGLQAERITHQGSGYRDTGKARQVESSGSSRHEPQFSDVLHRIKFLRAFESSRISASSGVETPLHSRSSFTSDTDETVVGLQSVGMPDHSRSLSTYVGRDFKKAFLPLGNDLKTESLKDAATLPIQDKFKNPSPQVIRYDSQGRDSKPWSLEFKSTRRTTSPEDQLKRTQPELHKDDTWLQEPWSPVFRNTRPTTPHGDKFKNPSSQLIKDDFGPQRRDSKPWSPGFKNTAPATSPPWSPKFENSRRSISPITDCRMPVGLTCKRCARRKIKRKEKRKPRRTLQNPEGGRNYCIRCHTEGHLVFNCQEPKACYICHSKGHLVNACKFLPKYTDKPTGKLNAGGVAESRLN